MPRLAALILLAGIAVSARRRPAAAAVPKPVVRPMTSDECRLFFMPMPSKAVH